MKKDLAIQQGRTMFETTVKPASDRKNILQSVASNVKIGKGGNTITKGRWKGMPMYSLTLEERKTCPKDCAQWETCYGNNSPFRIRVQIDETFYDKLEKELSVLNKKHTQGFVVRLHVLGDFPTYKYIKEWGKYLTIYHNLHVFGYTHHKPYPTDEIGFEIDWVNQCFHKRCVIRFSDFYDREYMNRMRVNDSPLRVANVEPIENATGIVCPEQTGKTKSCLTCGLCWGIDKPITFLPH